ncbi:helix-turn-helix domain-containing protein [Sphingomonas sp. ST-64]|uniref:Helix-turn-helix domain-containing protein n=1 Tax=Sphingomonas plantiphila TaxID=3163295 RepID=A0ABW8YRY3_9SPHN
MYVVTNIAPQRGVQRSRRDNRAAILAAGRVLSARHGIAGVTFDDIARETGLTRRTIYNHFANIEDLFTAAMRVAIEQLCRDLPPPPAPDQPLAALERYLGELLAFFGSGQFAEVHRALIRHDGAHPSLQHSLKTQVIEPLQHGLAVWLGGHTVDAAERIAADMVVLAHAVAESAPLLNRRKEGNRHHARSLAGAIAHMLVESPAIGLDRVA